MRIVVFCIPIAVVFILVGVLFWALNGGRDPSVVPSVMVGKPVPMFDLGGFNLEEIGGQGEGLSKGLNSGDFLIKNNTQNNINNNIQVLNFFASWCVPCRAEHGQLVLLAEQYGFILYGINYKDKVADARAWLAELGSPYDKIGVDSDGRVAIDFGLTGVPETFIINAKGVILHHHRGPIVGKTAVGNFRRALVAAFKSAQDQAEQNQ